MKQLLSSPGHIQAASTTHHQRCCPTHSADHATVNRMEHGKAFNGLVLNGLALQRLALTCPTLHMPICAKPCTHV